MKAALNYFLFVILLPINFIILLLIKIFSKFINFKIYKLETEKMGHFIFNTLLFHERKKKNIYYQNKKLNIIIPFIDNYLNQANSYLLNFWKKFFYIEDKGFIKYLDLTNQNFFKLKNINIEIRPYDYNDTLKSIEPNLRFTKKENKKGEDFLNKLGINYGDKYICLLLRDEKYLKELYPYRDYSYHDYRNVKISNYLDACNFLTSKGIKVIRMGKNVSEKFKTNNKMIIDYANHAERSDFMDIYISAKCYFWITVGSGIDASSYIFQKPVLHTNRSPVSFLMANQYSLSIIKHYFDIKNNKRLSLNEIYKRSLNLNLTSNILKTNGIELIENTSEEILNATKEFYDCLQGEFDNKNERDILNNQIRNIIKYDEKDFLDINDKPIKNFKNHPNFCYSFLIKNKYLLN